MIKYLKIFAKIVLSIVGLYALVLLICGGYVSCSYLPQLREATADVKNHLPAMIEDLKYLEKTKVFSPAKNVHNVEPFIGQQISNLGYDDPGNIKGKLLMELGPELEALPQDQAYFEKLLADPRFKMLYTDWLNSIFVYGLWDLRTQLGYEGLISSAQVAGVRTRIDKVSTLIRITPTLLKLARIHLIKMHLADKTKEGLASIRQLSQLLHTSLTFSGDEAAIELLEFERNFVQVLKIKGDTPIPEEATQAYERVLRGWQGVLLLGWESGVPEEIKPYMKPEYGLCGAVNELLVTTPTSYYYALVPAVFAEPKLVEYYDRALKLQRELLVVCGFHNLLPLVEPVLKPEEARRDFYDVAMESIPYLRRILGLSMLRKSQPDGMKLYRETKVVKAVEPKAEGPNESKN